MDVRVAKEEDDTFTRFLREIMLYTERKSSPMMTLDEFLSFVSPFYLISGSGKGICLQLFALFANEYDMAHYRQLTAALSVSALMNAPHPFKASAAARLSKKNLLQLLVLFSDKRNNTTNKKKKSSLIRLLDAADLLYCIFTAYYLTDTGAAERVGCDPRAFAEDLVTTPMGRDGSLSDGHGNQHLEGFLTFQDVIRCHDYGFQRIFSSSYLPQTSATLKNSKNSKALFSQFFPSAAPLLTCLSSSMNEDGLISLPAYIRAFETALGQSIHANLGERSRSSLDRVIRRIFSCFDSLQVEACFYEDLVCGILLLTKDPPEMKSEVLVNLFFPEDFAKGVGETGPRTMSSQAIEVCSEAVARLGRALEIDVYDFVARLAKQSLEQLSIEEKRRDYDVMAVDIFWQFCYALFADLQAFPPSSNAADSTLRIKGENLKDDRVFISVDEEEEEEMESTNDFTYGGFVYQDTDSRPITSLDRSIVANELSSSRRRLHLTNVKATELRDIFLENSLRGGVISRSSFVFILELLSTIDQETAALDEKDLADDLRRSQSLGLRIFDFFLDPDGRKGDDVVELNALLTGLIILSDSPAAAKLEVIYSIHTANNHRLLKRTDVDLILLSILRVILCCSDAVAVRLSAVETDLESLVRQTTGALWTLLKISPDEKVSLDLLSQIMDRCIALSYT